MLFRKNCPRRNHGRTLRTSVIGGEAFTRSVKAWQAHAGSQRGKKNGPVARDSKKEHSLEERSVRENKHIPVRGLPTDGGRRERTSSRRLDTGYPWIKESSFV